jgi:hypothetical protein
MKNAPPLSLALLLLALLAFGLGCLSTGVISWAEMAFAVAAQWTGLIIHYRHLPAAQRTAVFRIEFLVHGVSFPALILVMQGRWLGAPPVAVQATLVAVYACICFARTFVSLVTGRAHALREQRALRGECMQCGYDLRATPTRCPECGAAAPEVVICAHCQFPCPAEFSRCPDCRHDLAAAKAIPAG